jgi:hypothetical protein
MVVMFKEMKKKMKEVEVVSLAFRKMTDRKKVY